MPCAIDWQTDESRLPSTQATLGAAEEFVEFHAAKGSLISVHIADQLLVLRAKLPADCVMRADVDGLATYAASLHFDAH